MTSDGRCSCGARTESSSGLCGNCQQRTQRFYASSAMTNTPPPLSPEIQRSRQRLLDGYCEHSEAPNTYEGQSICGDCQDEAAGAIDAAYRLGASDVQELKDAIQEISNIYNRDGVAQQDARRLEAIFDRYLFNDVEVSPPRWTEMRQRAESVEAQLAEAHARLREMEQAAEMLWVVLANVSGGDWTQQPQQWQDAAACWRDRYFAALSPAPAVPPRVHHMKHGDSTLCGAAKERGNSYYEWAYVNCPECKARGNQEGRSE